MLFEFYIHLHTHQDPHWIVAELWGKN